jgi:hypothetical protein
MVYKGPVFFVLSFGHGAGNFWAHHTSARQAVPPERVFQVQCRSCLNKFEVPLSSPQLSADFPFTCKDCCGDQSVLDTPIEKLLDGKSPGQKSQGL